MSNLDAQAVYGWMDNYCQANPTAQIVDAANEFIRQRPQ